MEFNFGQQPQSQFSLGALQNTPLDLGGSTGFEQQIFQQPNFGTQNPGISGVANPTGLNTAALKFDAAGNQINPGTGGGDSGSLFGIDGKGIGLALGGLQTIGNLFSSFQQNKLAKKSFDLQNRAFETNLAFNTKQANNSLEDRIRTRFATEGRSEQADAKIAEQRLEI